MRATFITLALEHGADPLVIESRVTHTKKTRSAFDGYNRGKQWEATCREVSKLAIVRPARYTAVTAVESSTVNVVEAAGVERTSSDVAVPSCSQIRAVASRERTAADDACNGTSLHGVALLAAMRDFVMVRDHVAVVDELERRGRGGR